MLILPFSIASRRSEILLSYKHKTSHFFVRVPTNIVSLYVFSSFNIDLVNSCIQFLTWQKTNISNKNDWKQWIKRLKAHRMNYNSFNSRNWPWKHAYSESYCLFTLSNQTAAFCLSQLMERCKQQMK